MKIEYAKNLSDAALDQIIQEIIDERCKRCGIKEEELFGKVFNKEWIKNWIRADMPMTKEDQDHKYEALMTGFREDLIQKLSETDI